MSFPSRGGPASQCCWRFQWQRRYDPYANTYNPGWRDHPNFSYARGQQYPSYQQRNQAQAAPQNPNAPLEEIVKNLANTVQSLEKQVSQVATSMSKFESQGKLPSQTEINPRQNVSAITLRSGKELQDNGVEKLQKQAMEENLPESD